MLTTLCAEFAGQTREPDFTTEATEATEAGGKGLRSRLRTFLSFRSVSVISVASVVKSGADVRQTAVSTNLRRASGTRRSAILNLALPERVPPLPDPTQM